MKKTCLFSSLMLFALTFAGCSKSNPTDLRIFELKGNVKSVEVYYTTNVTYNGRKTRHSVRDEGTLYNFDKEGLYISASNSVQSESVYEGNYLLERNDKGQIVKIERPFSEDNIGGIFSYTWDENGFPITESFEPYEGFDTYATLEYSEDSCSLAKKTIYYDGSLDCTNSYKILESDSHGNWTKRIITSVYPGEYPSLTSYTLEERIITYYENADNKAGTGLRVEKQKSIEDLMYERNGDYALFESDYTINGKQIWAVFLKEEEMVIFINSNNIHRSFERGLRYEYEIRDNKLRFFNGYEVYGLENANVNHYPETSAEIYLDGDGVTFANMKQYGNRHNVHISATLSNETLPEQLLEYVKEYARENVRGWNKNNYY